MPVWQWLVESAGVLLLLLLAYGFALIVRRRVLSRHGGTFELSHRLRTSRPGHGWVVGLGRYQHEDLEWFRIFSLSPRPRRVWSRRKLTYTGSRPPAGAERRALYPGHLVVTCTAADLPCELAMDESSLMGFQSWLEAGPPGTDWNRHRT